MKRKSILLALLLSTIYLFLISSPLLASDMPEYICEFGLKLYREGRYEEALHEFKKALMVRPGYQPALKYIRMIKQVRPDLWPEEEERPVTREPEKKEKERIIERAPSLTTKAKRQEELKEAPEKTPAGSPKETPKKIPEKIQGKIPEKTTGKIIPENIPVEQITPTELYELEREIMIDKRLAQPPEREALLPGEETIVIPRREAESEFQPATKVEEGVPSSGQMEPLHAQQIEPTIEKKLISQEKLALEEAFLSRIKQPIEIEQGAQVIIKGKNIRRFLLTQPEILSLERQSPDELLLTGKGVGYTYLHIWDDSGRWTMEWLGIFPRPEGLTYEELLRREEQRARTFKLRYTLDWYLYEVGRGLSSLRRNSYAWSHNLLLTGPTPYGDLDSYITVRRFRTSADLTYLTFGLTNGLVGSFKGFSIRGFDFAPHFSNLTFPGTTLRGAMLESPAFNNRLYYTTFWGREGGGRFGDLSPDLVKIQNSFLGGFNLNLLPTDNQIYKFTLIHGWGRDRESFLNSYGYDLSGNWNLNNFKLGYEIAYDSQKKAQLLTANYKDKSLYVSGELRDINKSFNSVTGVGRQQGQRGGLFNIAYQPIPGLSLNTTLDLYQDRLFPAKDDEGRWNQDVYWYGSYILDSKTNLNANYTLLNDLGKLSQFRYQTGVIGISRRFSLLGKDFSSYANYGHRENKNYTSHSSDYVNDRVYGGLRFSLIGNLYYYINEEYNWLQEKFTGNRSRPRAMETGLDWSDQIGRSPFYGNLRFTYRNEEDTVSPLSFFSGEDYIDGYAQLSFRPDNATEIYGSCSVRNTWADNPGADKRIDVNFNAGLRYLWDSGIRWDSIGNIEGYIFKDLNADGLMQRDEAPVEGVKIWLGKKKFLVTDLFGYYKFKDIRGAKAYVNLDTTTVPSGFVLTVPATQETPIINHYTQRVNFGMVSRSEITGLIFEDINGDGQFDGKDKPVQGVVMSLEDGSIATTDDKGRYNFSDASVGEHTLNLDLKSLAVYYLPQQSISKKIILFEGVTYIHNIPLKRVKE